MKLKRIIEKNENFKIGYSLYLENFPMDQTRNEETQLFILKDETYHFDMILSENEFSGIITYWEYDEYIYIEHFAICSDKRGNGLGSQVLSLLKQKNKLLILEIEPPICNYTKSRQAFYERSGFVLHQYKHTPPAYRKGYANQDLVIMSTGELNDKLYQTYFKRVCENILNPLKSC